MPETPGDTGQQNPPANSEPTGKPTISGTPQVGQTLTASTSGITDQDGLTNAAFSYRWIAGGSDISGATGSTYTLTSSEQGKTIQVRVTFTDDAANQETLTSAATVAVAAPAPLTASLPNSRFQSARHQGTDDRPQVIVAFSLPVASFEKTTPSVSLTGATLSSVRRHQEDGLENAWIFFLDPDADGDILLQPADRPALRFGRNLHRSRRDAVRRDAGPPSLGRRSRKNRITPTALQLARPPSAGRPRWTRPSRRTHQPSKTRTACRTSATNTNGWPRVPPSAEPQAPDTCSPAPSRARPSR